MDRRRVSGRRAAAAAVALACLVLCGCTATPGSGRIYWGDSTKNCQNGECAYGSNAQTLTATQRCGTATTLVWSAQKWIHGYVDMQLTDGDGKTVYSQLVANDQDHARNFTGASGVWTLTGATHDANGIFDARVRCR